MIVRMPEIEITAPSRSTVLSWGGKAVIACAAIAGLVALADWRLNSRMDRSGLERLAAGTTADPVTTGSTGPKRKPRRPAEGGL